MANAMPQAIGAALACPDRQVVALCGDGGLSMLLGDLATIKQYDLPIKIIVFNNRSLGMVKLEMEVMGLPDFEVDMQDPDFSMIAEAMGIRGITISDPEQLEDSLKQAFDHKGPVLVNVMTDGTALALPPHIELNMVKSCLIPKADRASVLRQFGHRVVVGCGAAIANAFGTERVFTAGGRCGIYPEARVLGGRIGFLGRHGVFRKIPGGFFLDFGHGSPPALLRGWMQRKPGVSEGES